MPDLVVLEGYLGATSGALRTCKTGPVGERLVEIEFLDAGVEAMGTGQPEDDQPS